MCIGIIGVVCFEGINRTGCIDIRTEVFVCIKDCLLLVGSPSLSLLFFASRIERVRISFSSLVQWVKKLNR